MAPPRLVIVPVELSSTWPDALQSELSRLGCQIDGAKIWRRCEYSDGDRTWFECRVSRGRAGLLIFSFRKDHEQDFVGIGRQHHWEWLHPNLYRDETQLAAEFEELLVRLGAIPDFSPREDPDRSA